MSKANLFLRKILETGTCCQLFARLFFLLFGPVARTQTVLTIPPDRDNRLFSHDQTVAAAASKKYIRDFLADYVCTVHSKTYYLIRY